jgi:hypothetical protein
VALAVPFVVLLGIFAVSVGHGFVADGRPRASLTGCARLTVAVKYGRVVR